MIAETDLNRLLRSLVCQTVNVRDLRQAFPGLSFTMADARDMDESPFAQTSAFDLHLVNGSGHCWMLTDDPQAATGVVLARR